MTYDDEAWLHSKVFGFFHPELAIALGQCLLQVYISFIDLLEVYISLIDLLQVLPPCPHLTWTLT